MAGVANVSAQSQNRDTLSVYAGVTPLSELLTEEQKNTVKVLNVTGTLLDEDYAFLRTELLNRLQTLNLREAEIDTIPDKAFCTYGGTEIKDGLKYVLPEMLKYVGDSAFLGNSEYLYHGNYSKYELVITGNFPSIGKLSLWSTYCYDMYYLPYHVTIAIDNGYCTEIIDPNTNFSAIYSADSSVLYFVNNLPDEEFRIPEHTKVIGDRAFEYSSDVAVIIPSSVDSIGDYAFANILQQSITGKPQKKYSPEYVYFHRLICEAINPPKLGKEVFYTPEEELYGGTFFRGYNFYVPDESVDVYKNTDVWKEFYEIRPISRILAPDGLSSADIENTILQKTGNGYLLKSDKPIKEVSAYSMSGERLWVVYPTIIDSEIEIPRLGTNLLLLKILFVNGSQETFKLEY